MLVSAAGGQWPRWRHDGQEIFYLSLDDKVMAAPVTGRGPTRHVGPPVALFDVRPRRAGSRWPYSPALDGQRFLVNASLKPSASVTRSYSLAQVDVAPITVVVHWAANGK